MKKITKILSLVVSTILVAVMMTACSGTSEGSVSPVASEMQEKLANAGYTAVAEYDMNSRVSIVTAKCELSFKYAGKEKVFFTDWVSADWYPSEKDAELGYVQAEKVKGNLILKRDGDVVYLGTENGIKLFEHEIPATVDEGKQVMQSASYVVTDDILTTLETTANVTRKFTATLGEESISVYYFNELSDAANYYSRNSKNYKGKVFEKQGNFVYGGTETAVATYKGIENINVIVDGYKAKLEALDYNAYAYKKGMAGAVKAKKKGGGSEFDIQVAWFTTESAANEAKTYLDALYKDNINRGQIKVILEGKMLFVGTEQAIADFKA